MASDNCPTCPQPRECACPEGRQACRRGACPCLPTCPCKQGCLPPLPPWFPWGDDFRRPRKFGCLGLVIAVVVIITILILVLRDGGDDGPSNSPAPTTTSTVAPATTIAATTTVAPTTEPPVVTTVAPVITPVSPDLRAITDAFCLPVPSSASEEEAWELLFADFETTRGPNPGDTPAPLNSDDPALEFLRVGVLRGDCGGDPFTMIIAELGGPPEQVQLSLGIDLLPDAGATPKPDGNSGIARVGGFELFAAVEPDGSTFTSDSNFQPIDQRVAAQVSGTYFAIAIYESEFAPIDADLTFHVQTFRRDVQEAGAPIDWELATGQSR